MEHLLDTDWNFTESDTFLNEDELDNCVIERIIQNRFKNPMIYSNAEEERSTVDWDSLFTKLKISRNIVPGLRDVPCYPKLSALTDVEQYGVLRILCAQVPSSFILQKNFKDGLTKEDYNIFDAVHVTYAKEQKEFIEWAKNLWTTEHCIRALRPKPPVEIAYDAEFNIKVKEMNSFPKTYRMAAQISLETGNYEYDMNCEKELIGVDISELRKCKFPKLFKKKLTIMKMYDAPVPCAIHQCRFVLPNESLPTILPLTEVHRELAQYAFDNGAKFIASEKALKCLLEVDRGWTINLSVCEVYSMDEEKRTVLVLGGELMLRKETSQIRTYRAFRHLLQQALVPNKEMLKFRCKRSDSLSDIEEARSPSQSSNNTDSSDDEDLNIVDEEEQTDNDSDTDRTDDLSAGKSTKESLPLSSKYVFKEEQMDSNSETDQMRMDDLIAGNSTKGSLPSSPKYLFEEEEMDSNSDTDQMRMDDQIAGKFTKGSLPLSSKYLFEEEQMDSNSDTDQMRTDDLIAGKSTKGSLPLSSKYLLEVEQTDSNSDTDQMRTDDLIARKSTKGSLPLSSKYLFEGEQTDSNSDTDQMRTDDLIAGKSTKGSLPLSSKHLLEVEQTDSNSDTDQMRTDDLIAGRSTKGSLPLSSKHLLEVEQTDSNSDTDQMRTDDLIAGKSTKGSLPLSSKYLFEEEHTDSNSDTDGTDDLTAGSFTRATGKKNECTCTERLPPRSFKKWRLSNLDTNDNYDVIIHCSHKVKDENGEVLLEPIPEYQLDLGAHKLSEEKHTSMALSLILRENASLITARVDGSTGEIVLLDTMSLGKHVVEHGDQTSDIAHTIMAVLGQLQHLIPGHYLLHHQVGQGRKALVYADSGGDGDILHLDLESSKHPCDVEESLGVKDPPTLEPIVLPMHTHRMILPCAFTTSAKEVLMQDQDPSMKQNEPPSTVELEAEAGTSDNVKWPKKG